MVHGLLMQDPTSESSSSVRAETITSPSATPFLATGQPNMLAQTLGQRCETGDDARESYTDYNSKNPAAH
jgi:hypothetical protein